MAQIFHRSTNFIARFSVFFGALLAALALGGVMGLARAPYLTNQNVTREQPIQFSHKHHVGDDGIDCRYCHTAVESSATAGIPPTKTCMNCHSVLFNNAGYLEPVRESYRTDKSIEWVRVHRLADYVYFNHSIHINKGVGCSTCHGQVNQMPLMFQASPLLMQWCLECHRNPEAVLRPRDQVFNMDWKAPANQAEVGKRLAAVRAKLQSKSGKQYWRTIEELAEDPHFEDLLHREFPRQASEWDEAVDRRDFLKLMAASLAFAGLSGCKANVQTHIVPYVKQPDGLVLGKPLFFATAMPFGGDAIGVLGESHEGRPTKIEGNPDHPASLGGTDAITQASVLNLYDPDRAQTVTFAGEIRTWSAFLDAAQTMGAEIKAANGSGFRILTGTITSPSIAEQLQYLLKLYPQAKWHQWEPAGSDGAREGGKLAF